MSRATPAKPARTRTSPAARGTRIDAGHRSDSAKAAICDATERLLGRMPLLDVSVADILKEAGVSRTTFYYHYDSKFAVVGDLLTSIMDRMFDVVQPFLLVADHDDADLLAEYTAALRTSLYGAARIWRDHRAVLQATSELWHVEPQLRALWLGLTGRFVAPVAETIDHLRAIGVVPVGPPSNQIAATLAWSTERCLYVASLDADEALPDEATLVEPLMGLWLGGVFGAGSATTPRRR